MILSLAITTYNRPELTIKSFSKIPFTKRTHDMDRPGAVVEVNGKTHPIDEVIISDDCSDNNLYDKLLTEVVKFNHEWVWPSVLLYRNEKNLGMMLNKRRAIELCHSEWVIILDSDNVIDSKYLYAIPEKLDPNVIYCPSFARPTFDYRRYAGMTIGIPQAKKMLNEPMGNACLNTCNYLVHRETYLQVFKEHNVKGTDTIAFNYEWLKAGKKMHVVKGMEYDHLVHDGSGFLKDAEFNMKKAEEYKLKIQSL